MPKADNTDPVTIELPNGKMLSNGTVAVVLSTLDELDAFWRENKQKLPYSCQGIESGSNPAFLRDCHWVFGSSKSAVIESVLRLGQSKISVEFYNWKKDDPLEWEDFFLQKDAYRQEMKQRETWTAELEKAWSLRTRENYHGWWRFENVPESVSVDDWFCMGEGMEEVVDPALPMEVVTKRLCELTFEEWRKQDMWELETHTPESIQTTIDYWKTERDKGEEYYGMQ